MINDDFRVVLLPCNTGAVHEAVTLNEDGSFTIFICDNLSPKAKQDAFLHALKHIRNNDFYAERNINEIEYERHGGM